jgi:hypothetical protein
MQIIQTIKSHPFELIYKAKSLLSPLEEESILFHSTHSRKRASQRGLSSDKIAAALNYGTIVSRQKMDFYVLRAKDIPSHLFHLKSQMENTVVLLAADGGIITCYRGRNPFRKITKKSKQLQ